MVKKTTARSVLLMTLSCVFTLQARAQLSGTISVPNASYSDLASVITALNTQGVGTGGVVINLTAGNPQTAPVGGYILGSAALNATTSATKTITINGSGNMVTANAGTGTADAIFSLLGVDYVTINGLNLQESATNTTAATRMEWGYNMVKLNATAPYDGCQNNTINNCVVSLNAANLSSCGIRMAHSINGSAGILPITGALATDANSNNRFTANNISNADTAMSFRGMALPGMYDYNNIVGGSSLTQGNLITVGGAGASNRVAGVFTANDSVLTVQYNQFSISASQTVNGINPANQVSGSLAGLAMLSTGNGRGNLSIRNNNFNLNWLPAGALVANIYCIQNDINAAYGMHSDINAKFAFTNNYFTGTDTAATSGSLYGLYNNMSDWNTDSIINNRFENIYWSTMSKNATGFLKCIYESGQAGTDINNNFVYNGIRTNSVVQGNVITNVYKYGTPNSNGDFTAIDNAGNVAGTGSLIYTNNLVQNCYSNSSIKAHYTGNNRSQNNYTAGGFVVIHKYNKADNLVCMGTSTTTGGGIFANYLAYGAKGSEIAFDTVTNCKTNAGPVIGVYKSLNGDVHDCYIAKDSTINGGVVAIIVNNGGYGNCIYNNRITGLVATGAGASNAYGLGGIDGGGGLGKTNIYNNSITDFYAPMWAYQSVNGISAYGIKVACVNYTAMFNVYHNTIKISNTSTGATFGVAGVIMGDNIIGLDLRNNIINLNSTPSGQGIVVALAKQSTNFNMNPPTALTATSGNNVYYVPSAPNCYYYAEGLATNNILSPSAFGPLSDPNFNLPCLSTYKAWMGQKERTSFAENNLTAISGQLGLYAPTTISFAKGNSSPISYPAITTDLLGTTRPTLADIGALQFTAVNKDNFPPVISFTPLPTSTVCANVPPTLTANIYDASGVNTTTAPPRLYYKKASEADAFGTNNTSSFNGWKYVTGTNTTSNTFTFTPNYSLLTSPLAGGDSLVYFVVAQDQALPANAGSNTVGFASGYCFTSVNLTATAAPTQVSVTKNAYGIMAPGSPTLSPASAALCGGSVQITAAGNATVPTIAQIGSDSTFNMNGGTIAADNSPLDAQMYNHRQQMIYTAAELTAKGMTAGVQINSLALNVALNYGVFNFDSLNIGMANTTAASLTPGNWIPVQKVYKGSITVQNGINTYNLNTPFTWDGTSNLVIDMISRRASMLWSVGVFNSTTSANTSMYYSDMGTIGVMLPYDSIVARSAINTATNYVTNVRPNIIINYAAPKPISWAPVSGLYKDAAMTIPMTASDTNKVVYAAPSLKTYYSVVSVMPGCNSAPSNPSVITPIAGFAQISLPGTSVCDSTTLHAPTSANVTYQWQKNGVNIPGANDSVLHVTANGSYRVYVVASNCSDTSNATVLNVSTSPVATVSSTLTKACDSLTLNANTASGLSYQWQKNGVNIPGATSSAYKVTASGNYRVYEVTSIGCNDTSAAVADTINVSPNPVISVNGTILWTSLNYPNYQWNLNGQPIPGATQSTYLVTQDGNYSLTVTGTNGCTGTSADSTFTGFGTKVDEVALKNAVKIFPNPATTVVNIDAPFAVNVDLLAADGKLITSKQQAKSLDVSTLPNGYYMLRIRNAEGVLIKHEKLFIVGK